MLTNIANVIVLTILIQFNHSSILALNRLSDLQLLTTLISKLDKPNLIIIDESKNEKSESEETIQDENIRNFKNKVLIKKIVPHSLNEGKIDYDYDFNAFYKPLVRLHRKKPIPHLKPKRIDDRFESLLNLEDERNNEDSNVVKNVYKVLEENYDLSKSNEIDINYANNDIWKPRTVTYNENIKPVNHYLDAIDDNVQITKIINKNKPVSKQNNLDENELLHQLELLIDIYHHLNKIRSRSKKLESYGKIMPTLKKIDNLRASYDKSGEDNDPLAPGNELQDDDEGAKKKVKFWMPYYPPWNYWTYKKTLHQDVCPGDQVRVDHMCIWIHPH